MKLVRPFTLPGLSSHAPLSLFPPPSCPYPLPLYFCTSQSPPSHLPDHSPAAFLYLICSDSSTFLFVLRVSSGLFLDPSSNLFCPDFYIHTAKKQYRKFKTNIPRKVLHCHSPNFHIHVSVSDLYIPTIDLPILLQEICRPILEIYTVYRSQTHECGNWD